MFGSPPPSHLTIPTEIKTYANLNEAATWYAFQTPPVINSHPPYSLLRCAEQINQLEDGRNNLLNDLSNGDVIAYYRIAGRDEHEELAEHYYPDNPHKHGNYRQIEDHIWSYNCDFINWDASTIDNQLGNSMICEDVLKDILIPMSSLLSPLTKEELTLFIEKYDCENFIHSNNAKNDGKMSLINSSTYTPVISSLVEDVIDEFKIENLEVRDQSYQGVKNSDIANYLHDKAKNEYGYSIERRAAKVIASLFRPPRKIEKDDMS